MSQSQLRHAEPANSARFTSVIRDELCAMQFQGDMRALSCVPRLSGVQTGSIDVLRYSGVGEQWGERDQRLIRADRADYYVICAPTAAQLAVRQNGSTINLRPGCFTVVSTARPFKARIRSESESDFFAAIHARVPGPLLRRSIPALDEVCGQEVRVLPGSGRLMMALFDVALSEGDHLAVAERERLGALMLEAICSVATVLVEIDERPASKTTAQQRTVELAKAFIESHLHDAELDPAQVAEHCGISTRYLHASFAACSNVCVAQLIRESRLQACRQALRDPRLQGHTIIEIAGSWGFDDPAHFCRLYKSRFDKTPREERSAAAQWVA